MASDGQSSDPRSYLARAIAAVGSGGELDAMLDAVLDAGIEALQPVTAAIFVRDPEQSDLQLTVWRGLDGPGATSLGAEAQDPAHPFAVAASTRVAVYDREAAMPDGRTFVGAYVPLTAASGGVEVALGSLGFGWPAPHELDAVQRETLDALATLAAMAVDRARLGSITAERSEWFERMAHTDALTGLANERTVARILELELARAGRQGSELSIALFDVDGFKATNEDGGHEAGDDVLRRVASVLADSVRLVDTVGRIGGDEFVLVAPGSAGSTVARRILDGISSLPPLAGRSITVSAGVARFPTDASDADGLIAAATEALERAKVEGAGSVAETAPLAEG